MKILPFLLILAIAASGQKIKVACVGNSITEGASIADSLRYPAQLQALLGDQYEVRNYGIGGRTLLKKGDFPYWQEAKFQESIAWSPDIVIIKLGTNDSKPQNWIYGEEFASDYKAFINSYRSAPGERKIYLCTPIPVYADAFGITASIVKDEIIPIVKKVAKQEKLKVIDLYTPMLGKGDLAPDGVHPNAAGAKIMAETVYRAIRR